MRLHHGPFVFLISILSLTACASNSGNTAGDAYAIAQMLASSGNCAAAVPKYGVSIRRDQRFIDAYFGLAKCQEQSGDYAAARQTYTNALQYDTNNYQLYYRRGIVAASEGDDVSAWQDERNALRLAPPAISAYVPISEAFSNSGDYADAVIAVDHALVLEKRSDLFIMRGDNHRLEEEYQSAVQDYRSALASAKTAQSRSAALVAVARMYQQLQQYDNAMFAVQRALALDPRNVDDYNLAASIAISDARPEVAEALYNQAIKETKDPNALPQLEMALAAVYTQENKNQAAIAMYVHVLRDARDPGTESQAYMDEGDLYAKSGQKAKAARLYLRAKAKNTDAAFRKGVDARIDALNSPP